MKAPRLADVGTAVLVLCAVLVTGLVVRREFFDGTSPPPVAFRAVADAERLALEGRVIGPADARVRVVEFSDFQCPFCARVQNDLRRLRERHPRDVAVVYRHFPLDATYPHARQAAMAAECAGEQGRFEAYHDALYADQAGIGVRPWDAIAAEVGVADAEAFRTCLAEERFASRIARDVQVGDSIGVRATPTFVVNGQMFAGSLPDEEWDRLVQAALASR